MAGDNQITDEQKKLIWAKGFTIDGYPGDMGRKDACGAIIVFEDFQNEESIFGWDIDHIVPISILEEKGISVEQMENILNLRPMNVANVISKGDSYPYYTAARIASGETNIDSESNKVVNSHVQEELKQLYNL